jgi:hypothetical protein
MKTERGLQGSDAIPGETDKQLAYTVGVVNNAVSRSASTADMTPVNSDRHNLRVEAL